MKKDTPDDHVEAAPANELERETIKNAAAQSPASANHPDPLPQQADNIAPGTVLAGRYVLGPKLGNGGMGIVYRATDRQEPNVLFAVKVLGSDVIERQEMLDLLQEEVRKTRALRHSNIVGVYSFNVDSGNAFIVMEHLEGKTLEKLIDEDFGRGMPIERAWPIIKDLGAALAYAHDRSIIHGDLKPSNVFVTTSGTKLLDFGVARVARGARKSRNDAVKGALTPAWASCEMLEQQEPDIRDDIYGFACILYLLLSGRRPFQDKTAVEARDDGYTPRPIASLTDRQNHALAQALAFQRESRTANVESLLTEISPAASSPRPVLDFPKWGMAAISIVGVAVAVGLIAYATGRPVRANVSAPVRNAQLDELSATAAQAESSSVSACAASPATVQIARSDAQRQLDLLHSRNAEARCASLADVKTYFDLGAKAQRDNDRLKACQYYAQTTERATVMVGKLTLADVWTGAVATSQTRTVQMARDGYRTLLDRVADERYWVAPRAHSALLRRELAEADILVESAKNAASVEQYGKAYGDADDALNLFYRVRRQEEGATDPNVEATAEHVPNPFLSRAQAQLTAISDPCSY